MAFAKVELVMAHTMAFHNTDELSPAIDTNMADNFASNTASKTVPAVQIMQEVGTRDLHELVPEAPKAPKSHASKPRRLRGRVSPHKSNAVPSIYPDYYQGPVGVELEFLARTANS